MFAWAPIPDKYKNRGSLEFAKELMLKADVAVSPGVAFGEYGEGFVRVGLVENEQRIRQAAKNIKKLCEREVNNPHIKQVDSSRHTITVDFHKFMRELKIELKKAS